MKSVQMCVAAAALAASSVSALALPGLNLVEVNPDVASGFLGITYNASTFDFVVNGLTQNLELPSGPPSIALNQRQFRLTAKINNSGILVPNSGTLIVRGDYLGVDQVLFSSNSILRFDFSAANKFEFEFIQSVNTSLAGIGDTIGTIMTDVNGLAFPGNIPSFQTSFDGRLFGDLGNGAADTFVPAPSAALITGLFGLATLRRRR